MPRPPSGPNQAQSVDANPEARHRLEAILETVAGTKTIEEACAELRISESRFHVIRREALQAAAESLEAKPAGRPPKAEPDASARRIAELEAVVSRLEIERRAAEVRAELAIGLPGVLRAPDRSKKNESAGEPKRKPPRPKRTGQRQRLRKRGKG